MRNTKEIMKKRRTCSLPAKMLDLFENKANEIGISKSYYLSMILETHFQKEFHDKEELINIKTS